MDKRIPLPNPLKREVRESPTYRPRRERDRTQYRRKPKHNQQESET